MIIIPIPEGFQTEGRDNGDSFEMTVTGHIAEGKLHLDSVEGIELTEGSKEEDVEMDEEALEAAVQGGPMA